MEPINGTLVLLVVEGHVVGHQRNMSVEETNETVDFSSKNARARKIDYGRYESNVTLEHLYVPDASGYNAIQTAQRAGTKVDIVRKEEGSDFEEATAVITSVSGDFPDQGEAVISVDLAIDGVWTASS